MVWGGFLPGQGDQGLPGWALNLPHGGVSLEEVSSEKREDIPHTPAVHSTVPGQGAQRPIGFTFLRSSF